MPFSILKKLDEDINKQRKITEMCKKEFKEYQTCLDENKECTDFFNIWIKCNEQPLPDKKN
tara:strand:- start:1018 stop:1200 length:183 start_codon:yes stop_codon:yes gene_type:complete